MEQGNWMRFDFETEQTEPNEEKISKLEIVENEKAENEMDRNAIVSSKKEDAIPMQIYDFQCDICKTSYFSQKYLDFHKEGRSHKDRELEQKIKAKLYCKPCKLQLHSFEYLDRHLNGKKHKSILKAIEDNVDLSLLYCIACSRQFFDESYFQRHLETKLHKLKSDYLDSTKRPTKKKRFSKKKTEYET